MDENIQDDVVEQPQVAPEQTESQEEAQPIQESEPQEESKGASQRIRELSHESKLKEEQIKSLNDRIAELTQRGEIPAYEAPVVNPGDEITPQRYTDDVTKHADHLVQIRMKQYEAETRHRVESDQALRDYPQLNPKSKEFDRELSDTVTEAVEAYVVANPYTASIKKFTDKLMRPYQKAIDKEVGQATEKIARQVSEAALRPTSVRKQEKTAGDKTIAELEAELGVINS